MPKPLKLEDYPETLSVEQAAEVLGICKTHAYKAARKPVEEGGIPSIWFGKRCRIPRRALQRLLEGDKDALVAEEQAG